MVYHQNLFFLRKRTRGEAAKERSGFSAERRTGSWGVYKLGSQKVLRNARDFLGRGDARQWAYIFAFLAKMELNVLCGDEVRFLCEQSRVNKYAGGIFIAGYEAVGTATY